jgi:uncharacterized protein YaaW (UPF0174 family)
MSGKHAKKVKKQATTDKEATETLRGLGTLFQTLPKEQRDQLDLVAGMGPKEVGDGL